ncbi:hypothetical protein YpB42003004_3294 [Yersinia pestis biovar Antiqua str. B42003004]|nr:hypothetical protein YpB42003004_3294 [Yersinia pestis biovar Antiqua str. B42003004]EIR85369.1 putative membrane protein [Yersinia pestis PY-36]EIS38366.1 putative membrane protein [Yersinia pestis PY-58]
MSYLNQELVMHFYRCFYRFFYVWFSVLFLKYCLKTIKI